MRAALASLASLAMVPWALVGCATAQGTDPAPDPDVAAADAEVRVVEERDADLVLYVSNQSFDEEEIRLTVAVDGLTVVDGDFHVEDQHNWVKFPLKMSPGAHKVTAEAESGAALTETFQVPGDEPRFAVIDYWGKDDHDSREFSWSFHREPVAFA